MQIADKGCAEERGVGFTGRTRRSGENAARTRREQQPQTHFGGGDWKLGSVSQHRGEK